MSNLNAINDAAVHVLRAVREGFFRLAQRGRNPFHILIRMDANSLRGDYARQMWNRTEKI